MSLARRKKREKSESPSSHAALAFSKVRQMARSIVASPSKQQIALRLARESALTREGHCCRFCGATGYLVRHEEPPRSHGGWRQLCERADITALRRRIVMICHDCHDGRHPGAYGAVKLHVSVDNSALGTDGDLTVTREDLATSARDTVVCPVRFPIVDPVEALDAVG